MRFVSFVLLINILFISCKVKDNGDHLPQAEMEKILLDVNLAEAYSQAPANMVARGTSGKNKDSLAVYYKDIFAHYKITEEQFTESLNWYKNHPDKLDTLITGITLTINTLQSKPASSLKMKYPPIVVPYYQKPTFEPNNTFSNDFVNFFEGETGNKS